MPEARSGLAGIGSLRNNAHEKGPFRGPLCPSSPGCFCRLPGAGNCTLLVVQSHSKGQSRPHKSGNRRPGTVLALAALEVAAGAVIAARPSCPPGASRAVDRLTLLRDCLQGVGR